MSWFFTSFYLESCTWPDAISRWIRQRNNIKFSANVGKSATETWQWLYKRSGKKAWAVQTHETENSETSKQQSQEHAHHFLWHQGDCSQRICPGRPNSQFRKLLWSFTMTAWKCAKTSSRTSVTKELVLSSLQRTVSHFIFHQSFFYQKQHGCRFPPTLLFCFSDWR
jgi:hypothetical protein